jgi:hypothetical protein
MKQNTIFITVIVICLVLLTTFYFGYFRGLSYDPSATYEVPAVVCEVNEETGWITFEDWNGEAWCIRDTGYKVGQLVILTFNDKDTLDIYDDIIVEVRRAEGTNS